MDYSMVMIIRKIIRFSTHKATSFSVLERIIFSPQIIRIMAVAFKQNIMVYHTGNDFV
jgi:hypothetical protein